MDDHAKRARARAQYYGPEMLRVIDSTLQRLDAELASPRPLSACEAAEFLSEVMGPLKAIRDRVIQPRGE